MTDRSTGRDKHDAFMDEAIREAELAAMEGEVPIGAVIVRDGQIIARGHNLRETLRDPTLHAEIVVIRKAAAVVGEWRLEGCDLYVTLEPCPMCAGAMIQSRIRNCYIGAFDPKGGACGSVVNLPDERRWNHHVEVWYGIQESACKQLLQTFFRGLRNTADEVTSP